MNKIIYILLAIGLLSGAAGCGKSEDREVSTRTERRAIKSGNKLYKGGKFAEAATEYRKAIQDNPSSAEAAYNIGLTEVRRGQTAQSDSLKGQFAQAAAKSFGNVAQRANEKPMLASRSDYNMGNLAFGGEDYAQAIAMYKEALRLNPKDDAARLNLRIAQKKLQQQDQNQDQNQDKDKDQNKQDQENQKDQQNQNQNQDQNQDQQQQPPKEQEINQQTADQILQAMENKENEIRARVMKSNNGQEVGGSRSRSKRW